MTYLLSLRDPLRAFQEKQDVLTSILHWTTQRSDFAEELLGSVKWKDCLSHSEHRRDSRADGAGTKTQPQGITDLWKA